jgi:serine/threonine-protein kinase
MICARCHRRFHDDEHLFCPFDGERLVKQLDVKRIRSKPTELQGQVVGGRYLIRGLLGKGAMARVFLAQDKTTGAPVAIKILDAMYISDPRKRARLLVEAKAVATIQHANIVEILELGQGDDGAPFLVMELLFGESLAHWLARHKLMSPEQGLPFVREIGMALAAAHRAGVVHRDVKPDNVFLLGEKGSPYGAKIVDFGFAKLEEHSNLTQAGVAVGTVEYMAPEQTVSDSVSPRTDVYGLGALMYRTFTGRLPFKGEQPPEVMAQHLVTPPPKLMLDGSPLAAGLESIVLKAMRKRPENRYASVEALLGDLVCLEANKPLAARVPLEDDDVYAPEKPYSAKAAGFLYRKLGKEPPPW